ncbi:NAD-P-binding protein [Ganoderma leucocontextum]|nr:NAD-P-binding protein [Ganoderma leucocontextum]
MSDITTPRVWFITGTSTGLGRAIAEVALEKGEIVIATARRPSTLGDLAQRHPKERLLILPLDVTQREQVVDAFAEATRAFGRIDIVFNNAGFGDLGEFEGIEEPKARAVLETNFWGAISVTKEAVKCFRETNPAGVGGRLLQMSSYQGLVGLPGCSFYSASKFALEGASEVLAAELDPAWNIKVTNIEPGWIRTEVVPKATWSPEHPAYYQNPDLPTTHIRRVGLDKLVTWKDARRSAEVFYKIACVPNPPLHFVVGKDAIEGTRKKIAALVADIDTYEAWSEGLEE